MTTAISHAIKPSDAPLRYGELPGADLEASGEAMHPRPESRSSLAARLQIGKTLLNAARDISATMRPFAADDFDPDMIRGGEGDTGEPYDDYRAAADPTEPVLDSDADSIEDEAGSDADAESDTQGESTDRDPGGDGQPRDGQPGKQEHHGEQGDQDDQDAGKLAIGGGLSPRSESRDGQRRLSPGTARNLIQNLDTAYKKAEVTLRTVGGMAMSLPVKMDQLTHAPELMLMQLNMELSQIIDHALYSQLADQKARNAMIADHQTMMDELRIQKGSIGDTESFDWTAHNPDIALHPESPARPSAAKEHAAFLNDPYIKDLTRGFEVVGLSRREAGPGKPILIIQMTRTMNGRVETKEWRIDAVLLKDNQPALEKLAADYISAAIMADGGSPGSMKLMDCLKIYGIVAEGKEPKNGGEVDAYIQKIKGVVDKLSSSQQLDMVRLQKMTNSRNEAFSMISNVNKQALDNRMAIVNNLR